MIKAAIEKIQELNKVETIDFYGRDYTNKQLFPVLEPEPPLLNVSTLSGVVDYINDVKDCPVKEMFIHVSQYNRVDLFSYVKGPFQQRDHLILAYTATDRFNYNVYQDTNDFIIGLLTGFVQSDQLLALLQVAGNLTDQILKTSTDDGVSQETNIKTGISQVKPVKITNPVYISPFCTFPEIDQPEQPFIFRLRKNNGIECGLFKSRGEAWTLDCKKSIRQWLIENLSEDMPIIL